MTFIAGMLTGVIGVYALQFASWYRRHKRNIALALEENEHWCAEHNKET